MKGIVILSYHKNPGAYVDCEFPKGISSSVELTSIEHNKIYTFNRMKESGPNYVYINTKNQQIASFFTGLDPIICTGVPNHCVYLILDREDPTKWEAELKQIALELLPLYYSTNNISDTDEILVNLENQEFFEHLQRKFLDLKKMEYSDHLVEKMIAEIDDDYSHPEKIQESEQMDGKMALMELEVWRDRVEKLSQEKTDLTKEIEKLKIKISQLEDKVQTASEYASGESIEKVHKLSTHLEEANQKAKRQLEELTVQKKSISQIEINNKKLQEECSSIRSEYEKYQKSTLSTIEAKNEEIRILSQRIQKQDEKISSLTQNDQNESKHPVEVKIGNLALENEIKALKYELQIKKKEIIETKKINKVQEREVLNLRELLDLN
ncbi:hypothetical protein [Candidatus Lokiarchaeum ossiferum]|uniref:hypothetical protein n=1 Tax=Candidatus Lokiarchaeum ossiferum TaxID=2951803 RepID=UPI00352C89EB